MWFLNKKIVILILLFFFFTAFAFAEDNFLSCQKFKLDNGTTVILKEDHVNPLVSVNIYVKASSLTESKETLGISHFYEHMFFRGTELYSGIQMKKEIETLGGITNAETNKDFTHYFVNVPSKYLKDILKIFSDALINAKFSSCDIESERKIVLEEYRLNLSNPLNCIYSDLYYLAFEEHPYKMPVIGSAENIEGFKREDFLNYKNKFYIPQNISLVIVGDFNSSDIMPIINEYFGNLPKSEISKTSYEIKLSTSSKTEIKKKDIIEGILALGFHTPGILDTSTIYPLDVLTFILGQGEGSILNQLKEKYKISLISADFITSNQPGLFIITATFEPKDMEEIKKAIFKEIEKLKEGKLSDEDYIRGKNFLINTYIFQNETNSGKASALGFYEAIYDSSFAVTYLDKINEVTKNNIIQTAKEIFNGIYTCVVYLPK